MANLENKQIVLKNYIKGFPDISDFDFKQTNLPEITTGQVLLKTIYISLDPYMRGMMSGLRSYTDPVKIGFPIPAGAIGEVIESKSEKFNIGDIVVGYGGWQSFWLENEEKLTKIEASSIPLTYYLGILGMPGHTAYSGIIGLSDIKHNETLIVSAATGGVGSVVGQIAKIHGAKVIGITSSEEKCKYALNELGFDFCYNRNNDLKKNLLKHSSEGIDINFENVGGDIFWDVLENMNLHGRVILCGFISQYNQIFKPEVKDKSINLFSNLVIKRLKIYGLLVNDWKHIYKQFHKDTIEWIKQGKLKYKVDTIYGIENAVTAFQGLLNGKNFGKLVVQINKDPTL